MVYHIKDNKRLPIIIISVTIWGAADLSRLLQRSRHHQQTWFRFFPRLMIELLCYKLFTDKAANNNNNNNRNGRNGNIWIRPVIFHHQTNRQQPVEDWWCIQAWNAGQEWWHSRSAGGRTSHGMVTLICWGWDHIFERKERFNLNPRNSEVYAECVHLKRINSGFRPTVDDIEMSVHCGVMCNNAFMM